MEKIFKTDIRYTRYICFFISISSSHFGRCRTKDIHSKILSKNRSFRCCSRHLLALAEEKEVSRENLTNIELNARKAAEQLFHMNRHFRRNSFGCWTQRREQKD